MDALKDDPFLFQIGAIKSYRCTRREPQFVCFYSKLVRLKAAYLNRISTWFCSFYSKLVRLKGFISTTKTYLKRQFLFQIGAIKRLQA